MDPDPVTVRQRLDELYRQKILGLQERFLSSLQNAPEVAENLKMQQVITENEKIAIISKPHRQHQKEAIFYMIARKGFDEIDRIIESLKMELTGNENLQASLKILKIRIWKECPFNRDIIQIKPVIVQPISKFDIEDSGGSSTPPRSKNPRSTPSQPDWLPVSLDTDGDSDDGNRNVRSVAMRKIPSDPLLPTSFTVKDSVDPLPQPSQPLPVDGSDMNESTFQQEVLRASADGDVFSLKTLLETFTYHPYFCEKGSRRTPLHYAVSAGKNTKIALECINLLIERQAKLIKESKSNVSQRSETSSATSTATSSTTDDETKSLESSKFMNPWGIQENTQEVQSELAEFINHVDIFGLTVMHIAAENECVEIVKVLYEKYLCDIFVKSEDGITPLDLMYVKTPDAIVHILNGALPTTNNYLTDGNLTLEIDYRTVIGLGQQSYDRDYTETGMLAKLVHQNKNASKLILHHVIVKTFLDFKWKKMKIFLYLSILAHILLHLWYTFFIVQVFLINCPYSAHKRKPHPEKNDTITNSTHLNNNDASEAEAEAESDGSKTIFSYLLGDWNSGKKLLSTVASVFKSEQLCTLPSELNGQAVAFLIIGGFFLFKEIYEAVLVKNLFSNGTKTNERKREKFFNGLLAYLKSVENIFQLIFIFLMVLVSTLAFQTNITEFYYSVAAFSIVVAWALILMQIGNISGLGPYVQILGKVIKSFFTMMATYMVLIIAFSISFSIMFHEERPFETLPKSFSRVIIMMVGELNYDETFYDDEEGTKVGFSLASHIIFLSFVVMVTIILINLLIGLTVSDVQTLRGKSEVILRAIQVEQLYIMENTLLRLSWLLLPLKNLCTKRKTKKTSKMDGGKRKVYLDIFVIDPNEIHKGMVLNISIKDCPRNLQKELRTLAGSPEEYMKEYMNKYSI